MANQVIVTANNTVQVAIEPTPQVQVQISRAAINNVGNINANNANYANFAGNAFSVNLSNVVGAGNIASINLDGNVSNVLRGNGSFGPETASGNANYANFAGTAYSVSGSNVSGAVANANFAIDAANANIANTAYNVAVGNVSGIGNIATINIDGNASNVLHGDGTFGPEGTTGNANYAAYAGNVTINAQPNITSVGTLTGLNANSNSAILLQTSNANIGCTVRDDANTNTGLNWTHFNNVVFNQSFLSITKDAIGMYFGNTAPGNVGIGNIKGLWQFQTNGNLNHTFGGTGNINAKGASITGNIVAANITANTGVFKGNAAGLTNIPGANVTGIVANANIANIAYSVNVANVNGIGNIATINLDGNVSNALLGDGTWGPVELSTANTVTDNAQPNITSVGNLINLTINANIANTTTLQVDGNLLVHSNTNAYTITQAYDSGAGLDGQATEVKVVNGAVDEQYYRTKYYLDNAYAGEFNTSVVGPVGNGGTDPLTQSTFNFTTFSSSSNLANPNTTTGTYFGFGADGISVTRGGTSSGAMSVYTNYGDGGVNARAFAFRRRRGNSDSRGGVVAGDYLGNLEWQGAATSTGGFNANSRTVRISAVVDGSYGGPGTGPTPIGFEFNVNNGTSFTHNFYANGDVQFANTVTANYFSGDGSNISNVANANYATYSGTVLTNAQPNITSVGNLINLTVDANIANTTTLQVNGNLLTHAGTNAYSIINIYDSGAGIDGQATDIKVINNLVDEQYFHTYYYGDTARGVEINPSVAGPVGNGGTDPFVTGFIEFKAYSDTGNLANINTLTSTQMSMGGGSFAFNTGTPVNLPAIQVQVFGNTLNGAGQQGIRFRRRRGDNDARGGVVAGDYLGNLEWQGAATSTGSYTGNSRTARIAARVDSSYAGPGTGPMPVGFEFNVNNGTQYTHNFYANGTVQFANTVTANYFVGDGSNLSNINGSNVTGTVANATYAANANYANSAGYIINGNSSAQFTGIDGDLYISTNNVINGVGISGRNLSLYGVGEQPPSNGVFSTFNVNNGGVNITQDNIGGGLASFAFTQWENTTSYLNPYTFFRARGNASSPQPIANGDVVMNQSFFTYGDSGNTYTGVGSFYAIVDSNDQAGNVVSSLTLATQNNNDNSRINLDTDRINLNGNVNTPYTVNINSSNIMLYANGDINATGRLDYLRTFGSFTSNATQTSNGANTTNYMTFNNDEGSNGVSIVSSSQITVARTGRYNIQFSAQCSHDTNQTANIEIWLTKNGSAVANTNSRIVLVKDQPMIASWNFVDNATSANTYYQLAWASPDTNVELLAIDTANTIAGVAIPSVIATITPVGA